MKTCSICKQEKQDVEFSIKNRSTGQLNYSCKECHKKYAREHYRNNHEYYLEKQKERRENCDTPRRLFEYLLSHPCVRCGESNPLVLDFDHIERDKKSFNISVARSAYNWNTVLSEIQKCQVLCANCHRKKTAVDLGWYLKLPEELTRPYISRKV